jgi:hypothetical protein
MMVNGIADIIINANAELDVCSFYKKKIATKAKANAMAISLNTSKVIFHSPSPENQ